MSHLHGIIDYEGKSNCTPQVTKRQKRKKAQLLPPQQQYVGFLLNIESIPSNRPLVTSKSGVSGLCFSSFFESDVRTGDRRVFFFTLHPRTLPPLVGLDGWSFETNFLSTYLALIQVSLMLLQNTGTRNYPMFHWQWLLHDRWLSTVLTEGAVW